MSRAVPSVPLHHLRQDRISGTKSATSAQPARRITGPASRSLGVLSVQFDYAAIKRRFRKQSPDWSLFSAVEPKHYPPYAVGNTPFFPAAALGKAFGFENVWLKNDGLNPSASLKDRASFLVVAEANRLKEPSIVTASTGNAASALAAVCAAAGKQAIIFVPESAPKAKLVQMVLYGARVIPVRGTYDDAFRLSLEYTARKGGLNRNTAYHPLTIEGKKTVGLEIYQQNKFKAPDVILVPVGDGVIISGVYKAFYDLKAAGLIAKLPRLVCVQAERSAAIHHYIRTGKYQNARRPGHDRRLHLRLHPLERAHGAAGGAWRAGDSPSPCRTRRSCAGSGPWRRRLACSPSRRPPRRWQR